MASLFQVQAWKGRTRDFEVSLVEADGTTAFTLSGDDTVRVKIGKTGSEPILDLDSTTDESGYSGISFTPGDSTATVRLGTDTDSMTPGAYNIEVMVVDNSDDAPPDAVKHAQSGIFYLFGTLSGDTSNTADASSASSSSQSGSESSQSNSGSSGSSESSSGAEGEPPMYSATSFATVDGTAEETLIGSGVGTLTILAGEWETGTVYRVTASGYHSTKSYPAGNGTFRISVGSVTYTLTKSEFQPSQDDQMWHFECDFVRYSEGSGGTIIGQPRLTFYIEGAEYPAVVVAAQVTPSILSSVADATFAFTGQFITSGNEMVSTGFVIERIVP